MRKRPPVRAARRTSRAGRSLLLVAISACAAEDGGGESDRGSEEPYAGVVELSIGSADGEAGIAFGRISGLGLTAGGRILVADAQANEVRVFSPEGEFLFAIGRAGAGPGEFSGPCCLGFDAAGRLWVRDGGNARYNAYALRPDGADYVRSLRMAHADVNRWARVTFDAAGRLIDIGTRPDLAGGEMVTARLHLDSTGAVVVAHPVHAAPPESLSVHTVTRQMPAGIATRYLWQPYGALELVAHSPRGGYAYALSSRYSIAWFDQAGELGREIRGTSDEGPALSAEERARAEAGIAEEARWANVTPASLPFGVPARKPPLTRLFFDEDGRLWVQLSVAQGEAARAGVYAPHGTRLHTATWPADVDLSYGAIRGDLGLGVRRDSLDVARVVRLRFAPVAR